MTGIPPGDVGGRVYTKQVDGGWDIVICLRFDPAEATLPTAAMASMAAFAWLADHCEGLGFDVTNAAATRPPNVVEG